MKKQIELLRKKLILEKAVEHFDKVGYEKTQVGVIAKELNIGVGTIYKLFGSKEGLFTEYLDQMIEDGLQDLINNLNSISDPLEKLKKFTEFKFAFFETKKHFIRDYFIQAPYLMNKKENRENKYLKLYSILDGIISEISVKKEIKINDCIQAAYIYDYLTDSFVMNWAENTNNENLNDKIDEVINIFLYGITFQKVSGG